MYYSLQVVILLDININKLNQQHLFLLIFWILYCLIHSFLANPGIKRRIETWAGQGFRYYRISYSLFAAVTLAILLWYQFSIRSYPLFHIPLLQYIAGICSLIPGIYIMAVSIHNYFYELSGIQALQHKEQKVTLRQDGMHRFVRHPLYLGTLLFVWGLFLLMPFLSNFIACSVIFIYTLIGIELEEKQLLIEFGDAYKRYSQKVPKLLPGSKIRIKK